MERRCVELLAEGYSAKAIAQREGKSASAVNKLLGTARERYGARDSHQLVALAVAAGEVSGRPRD